MNRCERSSADPTQATAEQCVVVVLDRFSAVRDHVMTSKEATILMDRALSAPVVA